MSNVIEILFAIVAGAVNLYVIYRLFKYFGIDLTENDW
jgi:hypothetical protein